MGKADIPNYRPAKGVKSCLSCKFFLRVNPTERNGQCLMFSTTVRRSYTCDKWVGARAGV